MNVVEIGLEWVDRRVLLGSLEPSTADDYRKSVRSWSSLPENPSKWDVEDAVAAMIAQGRAPSTVRKRLVTIRSAMEWAVERGKAPDNPFVGVGRPKVRVGQKNFLPADERERLKARISSSNTQITVAAALALYAGLREAEICALRTSDLDLEAGIGWVRRSVGRTKGQTYLKDAKNGHMRDFPLPEPLSLAIGRWVDSNSLQKGSFLLTGTEKWADPVVIGRKWSSLCELEGLRGVLGTPPTFHDLRHTYATVAIASGVDVKTVSSVLGHSSAAMTLDVYAVADPVAKRLSAEVVGRAI